MASYSFPKRTASFGSALFVAFFRQSPQPRFTHHSRFVGISVKLDFWIGWILWKKINFLKIALS
jgi:hypothetical protein